MAELPIKALPENIRNWDDFKQVLDASKANQRRELLLAKEARQRGEILKEAPYRGYKVYEAKKPSELIRNKNKGIRFRPDWNSKFSAEEWLSRQQANNPDDLRWKQWGVKEVDLDDTR
jgi:hypothetical protein